MVSCLCSCSIKLHKCFKTEIVCWLNGALGERIAVIEVKNFFLSTCMKKVGVLLFSVMGRLPVWLSDQLCGVGAHVMLVLT